MFCRVATALFLAVLLTFTVAATAQRWPEKPIRMVVPYPPGGNVDTAARIVAPGLTEAPLVLQVHPSLAVRSVNDLLDMAKKEPGKLSMASPGAGTSNHLLSELLQSTTGATWTTVHYKGNAPATTDLLAGQVHFNFDQVSVALPFIKQGKVRALAVTTEERVASMPDVPTFDELGLKGMDAATFTGVMAPTGTPRDVVGRLHLAMAKVLQEKSVIEKFDAIGAEARATTPEAFGAYLRREYDKWAPVIKRANIKAN